MKPLSGFIFSLEDSGDMSNAAQRTKNQVMVQHLQHLLGP